MDTTMFMPDFSRLLGSLRMVELVGIEPTTYGLQSRRSPS